MQAIIIILSILLAMSIIGVVLAFYFLSAILFGAPYIPTFKNKLNKILELSEVKPGEKVLDLGSGDGRIVLTFAKAGVQAYGYEINDFLVAWSNFIIQRAGLSNLARIYKKNFWHEDFSDFDVVVFFGSGNIMKKLEDKLQQELKPGAGVISNCFTFPNWPKEKQIDNIFLYKIK